MNMRFLFLLLIVFSHAEINGQTDLVSWSSVKLFRNTASGYGFTFKPIVRHQDNLGDYANTSFEFSLSKKLSRSWRVQYLYRYWYIDEGPDRVFWWFDVSHSKKLSSKVQIQNRLRWHLALDAYAEDPNFLRYLPSVRYRLNPKFSIFAGPELWWQLDGVQALRRFRHHLGINYAFTDHLSLDLQYWHEKSTGIDPGFLFHTLVFNLNIGL